MSDRFLWFPEEEALQIRELLQKRFSERTAYGCQVRPGNTGKGYPQFTWKGKTYRAHRVAYAVWNEAVPVNWVVCHLCNNPQCVNPSHLVLGTSTVYSRRTQELRQRDLQGSEWPLPKPPPIPKISPIEAMAFPKEIPRAQKSLQDASNRDIEKLAFPASYPDED